jgi:hypothetical protein
VLETPLTNKHPCFVLPSNNSFESLCEIVYRYLSSTDNMLNIIIFEELPLITFANVGFSEPKRKKR